MCKGMPTQRLEEKRLQECPSVRRRERERERERESALAPPFICFFPPPGPALCKLGLARSAAMKLKDAYSLEEKL